MARVRKCFKCKKKSTDYKIYKNKAICINCYDDYINSSIKCVVCDRIFKRNEEYIYLEMDKADLQKNFCSIECYNKLIEDRKTLDEIDKWLKDYFKMEKLNPRIYIQLTEFQRKYNMTPQGILYTLKYIKSETNKEILDNSLTIITWYYETAKKYYMAQQKLKNKKDEFNSLNSNMLVDSNVAIKVHRPLDNRKNNILIGEIDFS